MNNVQVNDGDMFQPGSKFANLEYGGIITENSDIKQ
jgi:hypothetical protein